MLERTSAKVSGLVLDKAFSDLTRGGADGAFGRVEVLAEQTISGWAFVSDELPVYVTCVFDGEVMGGTIANLARPDVAASARRAPANCGFTLRLDVKALLGRCTDADELAKRLEFRIDDRATLELMCGDPYKTILRSTSDEGTIRGHLDAVRDGELFGWCIDTSEADPTCVHVMIDGLLQAEITCSDHRSDIFDLMGLHHGGFSFKIPARYHDGASHVVRCLIPSSHVELRGSPIEIELRSEAEVVRGEVHTFAEACFQIEHQLATARKSFEHHILKKGPYLASYRFLRSTLVVGAVTKSRLRRKALEEAGLGLLSIILPTYKSDLALLGAAIDSVQAQTDPNWELVISDSCTREGGLKTFLEARAADDGRIKLVFNAKQLGIADNTNQALKVATGSIIGFLDHDDALACEAVSLMRQTFATDRYDLVYSDEDKINASNEYVDPHYKSAMNLDLLLCMNYICHFVCIRRSALDQTRMLRRDFDGAQDWDLVLQVVAKVGPDRVGHIPRILYHWRMTEASTATSADKKGYAVDAGVAAVNSYLATNGFSARAVRSPAKLPYAEVMWKPAKGSRLSVILPTKDKLDLVMHCVSSLQATIGAIEHEILIVDNASGSRSVKGFARLAERDPRIRIVSYGGDFNYSAINNYAVRSARYEHLLFLNNDTFFVDNGWAEKMLGIVHRRAVGAVGLKLLYPDNTVQHCGVVLGNGGVAGHAFSNLDEQDVGFFARAVCDQEVSAVTAACMMMRRGVFEEAGGFETEGLPIAFNDVDLCLRTAELGYATVLVASRHAYHAESKSRGHEDTPEKVQRFNREIDFMQNRWRSRLLQDRFYNPNFDLDHAPYQRLDLDAIIEQEFMLGEASICRSSALEKALS